jgi:hypothetical protein
VHSGCTADQTGIRVETKATAKGKDKNGIHAARRFSEQAWPDSELVGVWISVESGVLPRYRYRYPNINTPPLAQLVDTILGPLAPSPIPNTSVLVVSTPQASGLRCRGHYSVFSFLFFVARPAQQNDQKKGTRLPLPTRLHPDSSRHTLPVLRQIREALQGRRASLMFLRICSDSRGIVVCRSSFRIGRRRPLGMRRSGTVRLARSRSAVC